MVVLGSSSADDRAIMVLNSQTITLDQGNIQNSGSSLEELNPGVAEFESEEDKNNSFRCESHGLGRGEGQSPIYDD